MMNEPCLIVPDEASATPAFTVHCIEDRWEALHELVDLELNGVTISDQALCRYKRRLAVDVDQVMTEDTDWLVGLCINQ